jgi:fumarylpyruvate hydrolase
MFAVREMGGNEREPPFFFTKPPDAVVANGTSISYPLATSDLHHEVELVVAIGKSGVEISEADAADHIFGFCVGLDLTRRDLQAVAKKYSRPWDCAKSFDRSAPVSAITRKPPANDAKIWLSVNGKMRQSGTLNQMTWAIPEIISILSSQFQLEPGDLIFAGTPSGVGPIVSGDMITGGVDGLEEIQVSIV